MLVPRSDFVSIHMKILSKHISTSVQTWRQGSKNDSAWHDIRIFLVFSLDHCWKNRVEG